MFYYTASFPKLTMQQQDLLIKLVKLTRKEGEYSGEFWWRADPDEPNIVTQIKPRTPEGNFDPNNPLFENKQWSGVAEQANMLTLEKLGYVVISNIEEYGSKREKWRHFAVTQLGFDFYDHTRRNLIMRLFRHIWEKAESHLLAFVFGVIGALALEAIKYFIQLFLHGGTP